MRELRTGAGDDGGVVDGSRHCRCATGSVPPEEPRHERPAGVRHRVPGVTGGASENPRGDQFRRNRIFYRARWAALAALGALLVLATFSRTFGVTAWHGGFFVWATSLVLIALGSWRTGRR